MNITKGENFYVITEHSDKWTVKKEDGKLSVCVEVSKELCKTETELREYILTNDLF